MQSQSDRDARIRDRAYQIWLGEGRPHGQDEAHWQQAQREIDAEEAGTAGGDTAGIPSTHTKKAPVADEADPATVSEARDENEATAKKTRTRAAAAANANAPAKAPTRSRRAKSEA